MKGRLLAAVGVALVVTALTPVAGACSCARGDPRRSLERADGAFIGRLISKGELQAHNGAINTGQDVDYRFRVEEVFKGDIGDEVVVRSSGSGSSCGLEASPDHSTGLFLRRDGNEWRSSLCAQIDPDELRRAAKPLPPPDGELPARFLIGGSYGPARTISLDASGRTIAYGHGTGDTISIDVCPGGDVFVELVQAAVDNDWRRRAIALRSTDTLEKIREFTHEIIQTTSKSPDHEPSPGEVRCLDPTGDTTVLPMTFNDDRTQIVRFDGDDPTVVYEAKASAVSIGHEGPKAFLVEGAPERLVDVDVLTGVRLDRGPLPKDAFGIAANDDGTLVAGYSGTWREPHIFVFDVVTRASRETETKPGRLVWLDGRTVAAVDEHEWVRTYDGRADLLAEWKGFPWGSLGADAGEIYSAGYGKFSSAPSRTGPAKTVREFETPLFFALEVVKDVAAAPQPTPTPEATPSPTPKVTPVPTPEATGAPVAFTAPSERTSSGGALPFAAIATAGLAIGAAGAFTFGRRW